MIILAAGALVGGFALSRWMAEPDRDERRGAHEDTQRTVIKQYAHEAFPQWRLRHPDQDCPSSLRELDEYMNRKSSQDAWGRALIMLCGDKLPPGVPGGFGVRSLGADGKQHTSDDINSWD